MRPMATFLEACHDGPAELGAWLDGLASTLPRAVDARLGVNLGCFLRSDGSRAITGRGATWELAARYVGDSNPNPFAVRLTAVTPFRLRRASVVLRQLGLDAARIVAAVAPGCADLLGMTFDGAADLGACFAMRDRDAHLHEGNARVARIRRHCAGAYLRRQGVDWSEKADVILGADGRVLHSARKQLVSEAVRMAARQELASSEGAEETELVWNQLWAGGFSVATVMRDGGERYVVLQRRAGPPLRPAERRVASLAARGLSVKDIASELDVGVGTASTHLSRALHKLGVSSLAELASLLGEESSTGSAP